MPDEPALVRADRAARVHGRGAAAVVALLDATCAVAAGDRIAVVGPSGSGKSTLLHLMAGLDAPTSGAVSWPALGGAAALRPGKVGVVLQAPSLLPPLTVAENVELPLLLMGENPGPARAAALDCLGRLGLTELMNTLPQELSGGQAQRVAVARALVTRPRLVLADEPTGQLDHPTAALLLDSILALLVGSDTALVVATHDPTVAGRMDRSWRMEHGVLDTEVRRC